MIYHALNQNVFIYMVALFELCFCWSLFLVVRWVSLWSVIVAFPADTHFVIETVLIHVKYKNDPTKWVLSVDGNHIVIYIIVNL